MPSLTQDISGSPFAVRDSLAGVRAFPVGGGRVNSGGDQQMRHHAEQYELFDIAPHAKSLLLLPEAARGIGSSVDQVLALIDSGILHAISISDQQAERQHLRVTRLSVRAHRTRQAIPDLVDYGIQLTGPGPAHLHWCLPTRKEILRLGEVAVILRVCQNQARDLIPENLRWSVSDQDGPRQHWRIATVTFQSFVDDLLVERNFSDRQ